MRKTFSWLFLAAMLLIVIFALAGMARSGLSTADWSTAIAKGAKEWNKRKKPAPGAKIMAACARLTPVAGTTAAGTNDNDVYRDDERGMSRDIIPWRIRVAVFVRTRLCANAEIGVPRGRSECLRRNSCTRSHFHTPCHVALLYPQSFLHFPSFLLLPPSFLPFPRHSCEGRNLNQGTGVLIYISP